MQVTRGWRVSEETKVELDAGWQDGEERGNVLLQTNVVYGEPWMHLETCSDPGYGRGVPFWAFYFSG